MKKDELESYIKNTHYNKYRTDLKIQQEISNYIQNYTEISPIGINLAELVYIIKHSLTEIPKCACGNAVRYHNGKYQKNCSLKCSANNPNTRELQRNTNNNKYGCDNVFQSEKVKDKIKQTNISVYGTANPYKFGSKRFIKNFQNKYGVDNASKLPDHKSKTQIKLWGIAYSRFPRFSDKVVPNFTIDEYVGCGYDKMYNWTCVDCNSKFDAWYNMGYTPRCPNCTPTSSIFQYEVESYIKGLGISFTNNTRSIIPPLELDIYIDSLKIAIECNGNYWHSELGGGKNKKYHISKTEACHSNGIQLIHIFEDEWYDSKTLIQNKISHLLRMTTDKVYARNCTIVDISAKISNAFLKENHVQSQDRSGIRLGLYYEDSLYAVMTFSKRRFDNKDGYELVRYTTKGGYAVVGGAGKLLKHFERCWNPSTVISYADRRWSVGRLYTTLGFTHIKNSPPSYYYIKGDFLQRVNRINFQKHKLANILPIFNPLKSEWCNMKTNGYDRIWDCGNMVFEKVYI